MAAKPKKASAADRTISMFGAVPDAPMDARTIEVVQDDEKADRLPLEEDVSRLREMAFAGQEWTTKFFGIPDAEGNEYRVSLKNQHYYVETLGKEPGAKTCSRYVGLMVHERDLFKLTQCLVQAVRSRQGASSAKP